MTVNQDIMTILMPRAKGIYVKDVRIGLIYTAVMLENGQTGLAYNFHGGTRGCTSFKGLDPIIEREASELLSLLDSENTTETALALATANALANTDREGIEQGDILDYLRILPEDKVGMVGLFAPLLPGLKKKSSGVLVFEMIEQERDGLLPDREAFRLLPECQVAMITSTSLVNRTIDPLLEAARSCREVVLLGATTPLLPEVFEGTPVGHLSGVIVRRPDEMLRIVSEGKGTRFFKKNVTKVNLRLSPASGTP